MGNIKKVRNDEYRVPEESRDEIDVVKSKHCKTQFDYMLTNRPDIVTDVIVIN